MTSDTSVTYLVTFDRCQESDGRRPYKIGTTTMVRAYNRMRNMQVGHPYAIYPLAVFAGNIEEKLHLEFQGLHLRGEWFLLEMDDAVKVCDRMDDAERDFLRWLQRQCFGAIKWGPAFDSDEDDEDDS